MQSITNLKTQISDFISQHKKATIIISVAILLCIILILILVFTLPPKEKPPAVIVHTELPPKDPRSVQGYKFYQGMEYSVPVGESPITKTENVSLDDIKKKCDRTTDCGGFNTFTNHLLEYDQPISQWVKNPKATSTEGIYLKDGFSYRLLPIEVPDYIFLPGQMTNFINNSFVNSQTVLGQPINVVAAKCSSEHQCSSFNTDGALQSTVYTLPVDYRTSTDDPSTGIYVKKKYDGDVPASIKRATRFRK